MLICTSGVGTVHKYPNRNTPIPLRLCCLEKSPKGRPCVIILLSKVLNSFGTVLFNQISFYDGALIELMPQGQLSFFM